MNSLKEAHQKRRWVCGATAGWVGGTLFSAPHIIHCKHMHLLIYMEQFRKQATHARICMYVCVAYSNQLLQSVNDFVSASPKSRQWIPIQASILPKKQSG